MSKHEEKPMLPKSRDGIYPRCVWCNGEQYGPAVLVYSAGKVGCTAVYGCGRYLPADYITLKKEED